MADFEFKGMTIDRMIAHTIHDRGPEKARVSPTCAENLIRLDNDIRDLTQMRVTQALSNSSHGVEVGCENSASDSFAQLAAQMLHADDAGFIARSKTLANKLTDSQTHTRIPGGVLIIISGKVGVPAKRYLAAIKAETDKGFNVEERGGVISLKVVKRMLLSETQRLFKIGMAIEITAEPANAEGLLNPQNFKYFLFDHLLTATETKPAAAYFYSNFLGMSILLSAKHHTRIFFEETKNFINALAVEEDQKRDYLEALRTTLRGNRPTITAKDFAEDHLPEGVRDDFVDWVTSKGFPDKAVVKDTAYIKTRLRRPRQVLFSSGVSIRVPADHDLADSVAIGAAEQGYTTVRIKGTIEGQD